MSGFIKYDTVVINGQVYRVIKQQPFPKQPLATPKPEAPALKGPINKLKW